MAHGLPWWFSEGPPPQISETILVCFYSIRIYILKLTYSHFWGFPGSSAGKRIHLQCRRPQFNSWVWKIPWRRDRLPTPVFLGFPGGSAGKESTCNVGDLGLIPGLGRCPAEGKGYPLQYFGLENSMDCIVHGVTKSWTHLSNFHFHHIYIICRENSLEENIPEC